MAINARFVRDADLESIAHHKTWVLDFFQSMHASHIRIYRLLEPIQALVHIELIIHIALKRPSGVAGFFTHSKLPT